MSNKKILKSISVFCDESHPIKNDGCDFFIIGCLIVESDWLDEIRDAVISLKEKHGYHKGIEIKWSKINGKNINLVKDLIHLVKNDDRIGLRLLIVPNKDEKEYKLLTSHEHLYGGMYYLLLSKIMCIPRYNDVKDINIHIDRRNTNSEDNAKKLEKRIYYNTKITSHCSKIVDSKDEQLIQLIDIFLGAASYEKIGLNTSSNKLSIISYIKEIFGLKRIVFRSSQSEDKYNIFIWDGRYGKASV